MRPPYQICYECGRVYPTARDLRKAYRRSYWKATASSVYLPRTRLIVRILAVLTPQASRVTFCQECTHDFLFPSGSHR